MTSAPATFGKYEVITHLGQGGMAEVFLAAVRGPAEFKKVLVVKAMRSFAAEDARFRQMLLDEARLAARLQHPNVVQTIEVGDVDDKPFIAMEYLSGQPLNTILAAATKTGNPLGVPL